MGSCSGFLEEEILESGQQGEPSSGTCMEEAVDMKVMSKGLGGPERPCSNPSASLSNCATLEKQHDPSEP